MATIPLRRAKSQVLKTPESKSGHFFGVVNGFYIYLGELNLETKKGSGFVVLTPW